MVEIQVATALEQVIVIKQHLLLSLNCCQENQKANNIYALAYLSHDIENIILT